MFFPIIALWIILGQLTLVTRAQNDWHCAFIHGAGQFGKTGDITDDEWGAYIMKKKAIGTGLSELKMAKLDSEGSFGEDTTNTKIAKYPVKKWGIKSKDDIRVSRCVTVAFMAAQTRDTAWDDDRLLEIACQAAMGHNVDATKTITKTIIYSYSMGGLIMAGALQKQVCNLGSNVEWVAMGVPWLGTPLASEVGWGPWVCKHGVPMSGTYCTKQGAQRPATQSLAPAKVMGHNLMEFARDKITAATCGKDTAGEWDGDLLKWWKSGLMNNMLKHSVDLYNEAHTGETQYSQETDGDVPLSSCTSISERFSNSPTTRFFVSDRAHKCQNGRCDDVTKQWLENVIPTFRVEGSESEMRVGNGMFAKSLWILPAFVVFFFISFALFQVRTKGDELDAIYSELPQALNHEEHA